MIKKLPLVRSASLPVNRPISDPTKSQILQSILLKTILPWVELRGMANIFTAYSSWQELKAIDPELPNGATVTHRPLRGKRVQGQKIRTHGNESEEEYRWPRDKLLSARAPKLCFVLEGPVAFQIADYVLHCTPGHGILLPPGTPFPDGKLSILDRTKIHHNACELLMILPRQDSITCWTSRQWYEETEPDVMLQKNISGSVLQSHVTNLLYRLLDEATCKRLHWQRLCGCILEMIFVLLHRELDGLPAIKTGDLSPGDVYGVTQQGQNPIKRVEEYIQNNLSCDAPLPLTVAGMARYASLSRTIFLQQFRARTGKTFNQYVNDCRYQRVCELLQGSDLAIEHISQQVGISARGLRLLIQQRTGVSPTTLRRRYRHLK